MNENDELNLFVIYTAKPGMREAFLNDVKSSGILQLILDEKGLSAVRILCLCSKPRHTAACRNMGKCGTAKNPYDAAAYDGIEGD